MVLILMILEGVPFIAATSVAAEQRERLHLLGYSMIAAVPRTGIREAHCICNEKRETDSFLNLENLPLFYCCKNHTW
jgi:hypothetical protein